MICKINELFNLAVLVVDDSVVVRKLLEDIISGLFNKKIDMAKDGLEAVEMMTKKEYDLIITDINMPRMDGVKLVKHIRSTGSEVPIFVISGESDKEYFIDLINEEVCGFIAKPFNSDTVQHHLRKICSMVSDKKLIAEYQEKLEERNIELDRINQELTRANSLLAVKNSLNARATNKTCAHSGACLQKQLLSESTSKPIEEDYYDSLDQSDLDDLYDLNKAIDYHAFKLFSHFDSQSYSYIIDKVSSISLLLSNYRYFKELTAGLNEFAGILRENESLASEKHSLISNLFGSFSSTFITYLDNVWKKRATNPNYYDASLLGDMKIFEELLAPQDQAGEEIDFF